MSMATFRHKFKEAKLVEGGLQVIGAGDVANREHQIIVPMQDLMAIGLIIDPLITPAKELKPIEEVDAT